MSARSGGKPDSHGGRRNGSGRKPLVETAVCRWIVSFIRQEANCPEIFDSRMKHAVKRQNPIFVAAHAELEAEYKRLRDAPSAQRLLWMQDDSASPIEEIREIRNEPGFMAHIHIPNPNQFVMNQVYKRASDAATRHFGMTVSIRKVKDCANAWRRLENEIRDLEIPCEPDNGGF